jgi:hypothetical protein
MKSFQLDEMENLEKIKKKVPTEEDPQMEP